MFIVLDARQMTIYNWFQPVKLTQNEQVEEEEDIYDNMDDDDLAQVDEENEHDQNQEFLNIDKKLVNIDIR